MIQVRLVAFTVTIHVYLSVSTAIGHVISHGVQDVHVSNILTVSIWVLMNLEGVVPRPEVDSIFDLAPSTA